MKVLIAVIFVIGSAAAGSGPYLPSGWKPEGPAFYLPSEVQRLADAPLQESLFQESEASGSESLKEYGPPKLDQSPLLVTNQGLPDVITEQSFLVVAKSGDIIEVGEETGVEVNTNQETAVIESITTATESLRIIAEDGTTAYESQPTSEAVADLKSSVDVIFVEVQPTFDSITLNVQPTFETTSVEAQPASESTSAEVQAIFEVQPTLEAGPFDVTEQVTEVGQTSEVETTEKINVDGPVVEELENAAGVKNIVEALEKLEKEIKVVEVQAVEDLVGAKVTQEISGSLEQVPEGFLEYGPPGFLEYGPPKDEQLLRSAAAQVASSDALETNEVRRRRFSPKFRSSKKH